MSFPINHNQFLVHFSYYKDSCLYHNMFYYSKQTCAQVQQLANQKHQVLYIQPNYEEVVVTVVTKPETPWPARDSWTIILDNSLTTRKWSAGLSPNKKIHYLSKDGYKDISQKHDKPLQDNTKPISN